ncbi:MAG: hypothetical protein WKH64_02605 [Chloroflexia bacterium]
MRTVDGRTRWAAALELLYGFHPDRAAMLNDLLGGAHEFGRAQLAVRCLTANEPAERWGRVAFGAELDAHAYYYLGAPSPTSVTTSRRRSS